MTDSLSMNGSQTEALTKRLDAKRATRNLIFLFLTFTAFDVGVFAVLAFINQGDIVRMLNDDGDNPELYEYERVDLKKIMSENTKEMHK